MSIDPAALNVTKSVDTRGTACPGPLLEAKRGSACALSPSNVGRTQISQRSRRKPWWQS